MKKPDSTKPVHMQGSDHPDKGKCARRGLRSRHWGNVTCRDCLTHQPIVGATPTALAAMHKMAGKTVGVTS